MSQFVSLDFNTFATPNPPIGIITDPDLWWIESINIRDDEWELVFKKKRYKPGREVDRVCMKIVRPAILARTWGSEHDEFEVVDTNGMSYHFKKTENIILDWTGKEFRVGLSNPWWIFYDSFLREFKDSYEL